jgi:DNA-binding IclR family transcriptional regulator
MRSGLPRPTVSRLTRSLVDAGFLSYDLERKAYRLGVVCLSLAEAYNGSTPEVAIALPLMKKVAQREKLNAGLATGDQLEMVYLGAFRESNDVLARSRRVVPGSRVPIELTAIGRAYIAGLQPAQRDALFRNIAAKAGKGWPALKTELRRTESELARVGYCTSVWQTGGSIGIAKPIMAPDSALYGISMSFQFIEGDCTVLVERCGALLLQLAKDIAKAWAQALPAAAEENVG